MNNEQGIMNFEVNTSRQGGTNFIIRNSLFNIRYSVPEQFFLNNELMLRRMLKSRKS